MLCYSNILVVHCYMRFTQFPFCEVASSKFPTRVFVMLWSRTDNELQFLKRHIIEDLIDYLIWLFNCFY